jgi:hypothetical protein
MAPRALPRVERRPPIGRALLAPSVITDRYAYVKYAELRNKQPSFFNQFVWGALALDALDNTQ